MFLGECCFTEQVLEAFKTGKISGEGFIGLGFFPYWVD